MNDARVPFARSGLRQDVSAHKVGSAAGERVRKIYPDVGFRVGMSAVTVECGFRPVVRYESLEIRGTGSTAAVGRMVGGRLFDTVFFLLGLCYGDAVRKTRGIGLRMVRIAARADAAARVGLIKVRIIQTYGGRRGVVMVRDKRHCLHQYAE